MGSRDKIKKIVENKKRLPLGWGLAEQAAKDLEAMKKRKKKAEDEIMRDL